MVRIPSEYQEVEWIGTNGTDAYIDTGIQTSEDLKFTVDFQASRASARHIMGRYNNDNTSFYLYFDSGQVFQTAFGTKWTNTNLASDSNRHKFVYKFENGYLRVTNNDDVIASKLADFSTPQNIYVVGSVNSSRTASKTYSVTMSKNGTLIQNLIPCYRKSDNEPGMYDTVSKTFFTNSGTGTFLVGNDVTYSNTNLLETRRQILLNTPHIESMAGNPLTFKTDMSRDLKECKIHFSPVQVGEGIPSPENVRPISGWDGVTVTRCGKNLCPFTNGNDMLNWNVVGTNYQYELSNLVPNAAYTLSCHISQETTSGTNKRFYVQGDTAPYSFIHTHLAGWRYITVNAKSNGTLLFLHNKSGLQSVYKYIDSIQLELGTEATSYEPYQSQAISIPFPQTIYGGYVDLIKGEIVETEYVQSFSSASYSGYRGVGYGSLQLNYTGANKNAIAYSHGTLRLRNSAAGGYPSANAITLMPWNTNTTYARIGFNADVNNQENVNSWMEEYAPIQIWYELATPNVYPLTPQTIKALKGINNLYSDANGNIEVKFWSRIHN